MKKTLTNLLSFSLFALLSSFSLFANSATFPSSESWRLFHKDTCGTLTTGHASSVAACASAGYALGGQVSASGGCGSNGTNTFACNSGGSSTSRRTQLVSIGVCPTNSTASGSTCTPNSGFSAINTDPSANGGNGSWSVVPAGSECSTAAFLYNQATGVCDPVTENTVCPADKPHSRWSVTDQVFYCSSDSLENSLGVLSGVSGVSLVALSGAYATFAACIASLVCAAGLVLTIVGAATLGFDLLPDGQTNDQIPPAPPGKIQIVPLPADYTPLPNVIKVPPNGALIPPSNVTPKASNPDEFELTKDGVKYDFKPKESIVTFDGISGGVRESGAIQTGSGGSIDYKRVTQQPHGTVGGQPIKKRTYQQGTYTGGGSGQQMGEIVDYENETTGDITSSPPVVDSGTGQTGNGTGDCSTYGCATESTLRQVRDELQNTRYDEAGQVQDDLQDMADGGLNEASDRIAAMLQTAIDDAGLNSLFDDVVNRLPIKSIIATNTASCSFSFDYLSKPYELSICNHQETIHAALAFFLFVAMSFGIVGIIFERPNGGE